MSMRYEIRQEIGHTRLNVSGEYEPDTTITVFKAAIEAALAQGNHKLLIDLRQLTGNPKTMQRFEMGETISRFYHDKRGPDFLRVAAVGNEPLVDPERFAAVVANNRGLPVKVTTDFEEALRFLDLAGPR